MPGEALSTSLCACREDVINAISGSIRGMNGRMVVLLRSADRAETESSTGHPAEIGEVIGLADVPISRKLARLARFSGMGSGLLLLGAAGLTTVEILSRRLFHFGLVGVDELAGYAFAIAMAWGFARALIMRAHIRVDLVHLRLPAGMQRFPDVVALAAFTGIIGILVTPAFGTLAQSLRLGARASTPLATPLWIWARSCCARASRIACTTALRPGSAGCPAA